METATYACKAKNQALEHFPNEVKSAHNPQILLEEAGVVVGRPARATATETARLSIKAADRIVLI